MHDDIGFYIKRINDSLVADANVQLKKVDLTFSQMKLLIYLINKHDVHITQKEIEQHFNLKHTTVIGLLQRMERKGILKVVVNPGDKRSRNIILLDKAYNLNEELKNLGNEMKYKISGKMSQKKLEQLKSLLEEFYNKIIIKD